MAETSGEYTEEHFICHAIVWGEGWMSQGGEDEVAAVVEGLDLSGKTVLDIGSGLGGPSVALAANHNPERVVSIDIQAEQSALAQKLATKRGVAGRITYQVVEPGPFPFADASFDVVFSVGVFLQIPTKQSLYDDIFRVLKPGGTLAANDWLGGDDDTLSPEMVSFMTGGGLTFHWASADKTRGFLVHAGFSDIVVKDHQHQFLEILRHDVAQMKSGKTREQLIDAFNESVADDWLSNWQQIELLAERGEICLVQMRATKPG
ncbi:MAG: methyltransferase domain-containing protein [Alphaproteobacteria bacterium]